jgi:hypothetical protein
VSATGPKNIVSITSRRWPGSISSIAPTEPKPALLTSTSIAPKRSRVAATAAAIAAGEVTSRAAASTRSGASATRSSSASGRRAVATT